MICVCMWVLKNDVKPQDFTGRESSLGKHTIAGGSRGFRKESVNAAQENGNSCKTVYDLCV